MDHLKEGIGLRGYGQKDPLVEYKKESFKLFEAMMDRIEDETVRYLYFLRFETSAPSMPFAIDEEGMEDDDAREAEAERKRIEQSKAAEEEQRRNAQSAVQDMTRNIQRQHEKELKDLLFMGTGNGGGNGKAPVVHAPKTGRNDPCPCGSGKKYKKCHGIAT
jgi:preprotein translocase subunit SecA